MFAGGSNYRVKRSLKLRRWMEERKGEANRLHDALDDSLMIPAIPCKLRAQPSLEPGSIGTPWHMN